MLAATIDKPETVKVHFKPTPKMQSYNGTQKVLVQTALGQRAAAHHENLVFDAEGDYEVFADKGKQLCEDFPANFSPSGKSRAEGPATHNRSV